MTRLIVGSVVLISHCGKPTKWPVKRSGDDDNAYLLEIFRSAVMMCKKELTEGGTLLLLDVDGNMIKEQRGWLRAIDQLPWYNKTYTLTGGA
jgi:hypothetical protein